MKRYARTLHQRVHISTNSQTSRYKIFDFLSTVRNGQRLDSDPLFCLRLSAGHLSRPLGAKIWCLHRRCTSSFRPIGSFVFQVFRLLIPIQAAFTLQDFDSEKHGSALETPLNTCEELSMADAAVGRIDSFFICRAW